MGLNGERETVFAIRDVKAQLSHGLARLDGQEAVSTAAPLRRKLAPAMAVGLAGSLLVNNWRHAADAQARRKVLVRDVLVIAGTTGGLLAGWRFMGTNLARKLADALASLIGQAGGAEMKEVGSQAAHALHHHELIRRSNLGDRLSNLFKPQMHEHGARGFVQLESLAAGAILGGGLSGLAADAINGEDVSITGPAKLKEGLFQFIGNITFCTATILAFATGGRTLGRLAGRSTLLKERAKTGLLKTLGKLEAKQVGHPALMPTGMTTSIEKIMLEKATPQEARFKLANLLEHELPQVHKSARENLLNTLEKPIAEGQKKEVHQAIRQFTTEAVRQDIAKLRTSPEMAAEVERLAVEQVANRAQLFGVLIGLFTGVLGGAWLSNQVNDYLSKKLNFPAGVSNVKLFGDGSPGLLQGKLGDRGIHWWDAILHLDDWPSALYLAGVKSLESVIGILYGISGYLTGTAGTDYSAPRSFPIKNPEIYTRANAPLHRSVVVGQIPARRY